MDSPRGEGPSLGHEGVLDPWVAFSFLAGASLVDRPEVEVEEAAAAAPGIAVVEVAAVVAVALIQKVVLFEVPEALQTD